MRRVLLYTLEYPPDRGGVASYLYALHQALPNVTIVRARLGRFWPRWLRLIGELMRVVRRESIDCVAVSHVLPVGYAALLVRWLLHRPYVVFVHGLDVLRAQKSLWKRWWLSLILKNAGQVIANSEYTRSLVTRLSVPDGRSTVITPCLEKLPPAVETKRRHTLLTLGRLVARKNHRAVIEALAELVERFPDVQYVIAGDGPERERLAEQVRKLHLESRVVFRGVVSDEERVQLFQECDIFVLPVISLGDDVEGFGMVFLEAASFGKPVVAGRGGGVGEAVLDGATGILVDPQKPDALRSALTKLLSDSAYAERLGREGRTRVEREFLCTSRRDALERIYQLSSKF